MNSPKSTRVRLSFAKKVEFLELVKQGKMKKEVCLLYGLASSSLSTIIKNEQKLRRVLKKLWIFDFHNTSPEAASTFHKTCLEAVPTIMPAIKCKWVSKICVIFLSLVVYSQIHSLTLRLLSLLYFCYWLLIIWYFTSLS